jgi:type IV secretory pathway VirD2 relaxase
MRSSKKKFGRRDNENRPEKEKARQFMQLLKRFRAADQPNEIKHLGDELGRMIFGA